MNIHISTLLVKLNNSMATRVAFNGSFDIIRIGSSSNQQLWGRHDVSLATNEPLQLSQQLWR